MDTGVTGCIVLCETKESRSASRGHSFSPDILGDTLWANISKSFPSSQYLFQSMTLIPSRQTEGRAQTGTHLVA